MKLQRSTWTLLGVAVILGGYVLVTELSRSQSDSSTVATEGNQDLFRFEEDDIQSFIITTQDQTLAFEKDGNDVWQMTEPVAKKANDSTVAFLLSQLATGRSNSPTEATADQLAEFGLANPFAAVQVTLANGDTHSLLLGDVNFSGEFRYAIADPDPALTSTTDTEPAAGTKTTVVLVPNTFASAINRPLEEWQNLEVIPEIESPDEDPSGEPSEPPPESPPEESTEETDAPAEPQEPAAIEEEESAPVDEQPAATEEEEPQVPADEQPAAPPESPAPAAPEEDN